MLAEEKMFKYEMVNLPKIAIIGKEGLCTKEKNVVQDLWQQANSNFRRKECGSGSVAASQFQFQ